MGKYEEFSKRVLKGMGGTQNITNVVHCITRLRVSFKSKSAIDYEALENLPECAGFVKKDHVIQFIIGPAIVAAAVMIWVFNLIAVLLCCWFYGKNKGLKEAAPIVCLLSLILGGGQLVLAPINATISCFLPTAVALGTAFFISKTKRYQQAWLMKESQIMERRSEIQKEQNAMSFHHHSCRTMP